MTTPAPSAEERERKVQREILEKLLAFLRTTKNNPDAALRHAWALEGMMAENEGIERARSLVQLLVDDELAPGETQRNQTNRLKRLAEKALSALSPRPGEEEGA